jgi:hypothetical protein
VSAMRRSTLIDAGQRQSARVNQTPCQRQPAAAIMPISVAADLILIAARCSS